jgi:hypothetical protein
VEIDMKTKIVGILVCTLLIATAVPVVGTSNEVEDKLLSPLQSSDVEWSKTYGGDEFDRFIYVQETDDGGYFAGGSTEELDHIHPWVIKTDADGNEDWSWGITELSNDTMTFDIVDGDSYFGLPTNDGGYIACLHMIYEYNSEEWDVGGLAKLNASGGEEWVQIYAVEWNWTFVPVSLRIENDGYLVVGVSGYTDLPEDTRGMLMKTDFMGVEQWRKEYNYGDLDDQTFAVCPTSDDGYLLTGWAQGDTFNYWMIKTDGSGNEEWDATFGGDNNDYGHSRLCYQTSDGGYIMAGYSYSFGLGSADAWLVKTDASGTKEWDKTYGSPKMDPCWSIEDIDDGGYVFCVTINLNGMGGDKDDIHLVKIDDDGNIEWVTIFGGEGTQIGNHVQQTSDDGFIVAGRTGPYLSSTSDALLVKFSAAEANTAPDTPTITGPTEGTPEEEYPYNFTAEDPDGGEIYYYIDWGDGTTEEWLGPYLSGTTITVNHSWSEKGDYTIKCKAKDVLDEESDWGTLEVSMPKNKPANSLVKTFVWGPILFLRIRPNTISFRAVNVHYRIFGQGLSGVYKHKRLIFSNEFQGRIGNYFVCAIFDGTPL